MSFIEKISKLFQSCNPGQSSNTGSSYLENQVQLAMKEMDVSDLPMSPHLLLNYIKSILNPILEAIPQDHWVTFHRKRNNYTIKDDYGDIDDARWTAEFKKYFDSRLRDKLSHKDKAAMFRYIYASSNTSIDDAEFIVTYGFVNNRLDNYCDVYDKRLKNRPTNPYEYEQYCAQILRSSGWSAFATKGSGDQGGDIKAEKDGILVIFQCKLYSQPIGNKAVQEVSASLRYYGADYGAVVSNMEYTKSAKVLANSNNILLLNDTALKELNSSNFTIHRK